LTGPDQEDQLVFYVYGNYFFNFKNNDFLKDIYRNDISQGGGALRNPSPLKRFPW